MLASVFAKGAKYASCGFDFDERSKRMIKKACRRISRRGLRRMILVKRALVEIMGSKNDKIDELMEEYF